MFHYKYSLIDPSTDIPSIIHYKWVPQQRHIHEEDLFYNFDFYTNNTPLKSVISPKVKMRSRQFMYLIINIFQKTHNETVLMIMLFTWYS